MHPLYEKMFHTMQPVEEKDRTAYIKKGAVFSEDDERIYRYMLWRRWKVGTPLFDGESNLWTNQVAFIGLNPSTADHMADDNTARRCMGFAKDWGFDGMWMLNLFALRSTDPRNLKKVVDPVGPDNNAHIVEVCSQASQIIFCWGNKGNYKGRSGEVERLVRLVHPEKVYHLGRTKTGEFKHPLYLAKNTQRMRCVGAE